MGIVFVYQSAELSAAGLIGGVWSALPYFSISVSLNILLTLMIVIRLILYARNTRAALGGTGIGGLSKAIVTMFIESCALYAVSSLLILGPLSAGNGAADIFLAILPQTQARTFPWLRSPDRLTDVTAGWAGHRSTAHHPPSCQQERVYEQHYCFRTSQFNQSQEWSGVDGR